MASVVSTAERKAMKLQSYFVEYLVCGLLLVLISTSIHCSKFNSSVSDCFLSFFICVILSVDDQTVNIYANLYSCLYKQCMIKIESEMWMENFSTYKNYCIFLIKYIKNLQSVSDLTNLAQKLHESSQSI